MAKKYGKKERALPSREDLIGFVRARSGQVGKREIARAFALKSSDLGLKNLLRDLAEEGQVEKRRRKLHRPGALPSVVVADIAARDEDGDLIARPTEWDEGAHGPAPNIRIAFSRRAGAHQAVGVGDRALLRIQSSADADDSIRHEGRIVKLVDRAKQRVIGVFRALPNGGGRLSPVNKKQIGREHVVGVGHTADAKDGDLVAAEEISHARIGLPTARIRERLGSVKSERAVSLIAISTYDIPHVFSREALGEADAAVAAGPEGREDWRAVPFVTIDPADAKDHDDAVHAAPDLDQDNRGGFVISVAIADVGHYVQPASALDRTARERGNSVYFPDRVVPMLPERISNELCSLRPGEERAALAVRMVIDRHGRKRAHRFHRVIMRSVARLDYPRVQAAADGWPDDTTGPLAHDVIAPLYAAYFALKQARTERAPLDLDLPERKLLLTLHGTVDRVITPERLDSHRLIEEFMVLANVSAAETLERANVPLIYRVHDEPAPEKLHALREFLTSLDITFPKSGALRPGQFNRILARVRGTEMEKLVNEVVLRTQAQAEYAAENYGHFGLALRRYTHFTSPIRRYADLVVHRGLIRALHLGAGGLEATDVQALGEIAAQLSAAERRAMTAERETVDRLIAHFLADQVNAVFAGHISGVSRAGLFVKLDDSGADGLVPMRSLGSEFFRYHEEQHAVIGAETGETHRLGDKVSVRLVEAVPLAGALRFELLSKATGSTGQRHRLSAQKVRGQFPRKARRRRKH